MGWYFTITEEMRAMGLSGNELIVFALINSYSQKGNGCYYGGFSFLSEVCGISRRTAFNVIDSLISKGFISKTEVFHNGVRYVTFQAIVSNANSAEVVQNLHMGDAEDAPNTKSEYVNNSICNTKRGAFQKPTLEEVRIYCQERQNSVDPEAFINHYESNGWMVGKSHMKDWKAAVRTWEQREKAQRPAFRSTPGTQQRESVIQSFNRVRQNIFGNGNQVDDQ